MDCARALDHLYALLDQELTPELETAVRKHLENCRDCFPLYRFEMGYTRFLRARRESATAPEGLRKQIMSRIMMENEPPID